MENNKYLWDLESILKGRDFDDIYQEWRNKKEWEVQNYKASLDSFENFKQFELKGLELAKIENIVSNYISNNLNEDIASEKWNGLMQKFSNDCQDFSMRTSDYSNLLLKNKSVVENYLKDPALIKYKRSYKLFFKSKKHILSDELESILSKLSINNAGIEDVFSTLVDNDLKYADATNSAGKKVPLKTVSDIVINLKSDDRKLRKTTWINFNKAYYDMKGTLSKTLFYNYLMLNTWSKARNYDDYIHAALDSDEVDLLLLNKIYSNIAKFKKSYKKYTSIKKDLLKNQLNLKKIEPWDLSMELTKAPNRFSIEQAQEEAINALRPLGEEYISVVKKAFDEKWISWLPKQGKQTGAYSIGGCYGLDKMYISMNFDETLGSISTLVHELGHSLNSYYFTKEQDIYASCKIFYAEIASITNEMLLSYYWLDKYKNNQEMTINILCELIDGFFATTTRQVIFSNFEYEINKNLNDNKPITSDVILSTYYNMIDKYQGISASTSKRLASEPYKYSLATILRISHFYVGNFYVYKYAIGQIVAILISWKIYNNDSDMIEKYYRFLKSGTSLSPINTIKLLGIDLYDNNTYNEVSDILEQLVGKLINKS